MLFIQLMFHFETIAHTSQNTPAHICPFQKSKCVPLSFVLFFIGFLGDLSSHGALLCRPQRRVRVAGDTRGRGRSLQTVFPLRLPRARP